MFTYLCGTLDSVTLVTVHAQYILVNRKVKRCLYMNHEKSFDPCGRWYSVTWRSAHAQYEKHEFNRKKRNFILDKMIFYCKKMNFTEKRSILYKTNEIL